MAVHIGLLLPMRYDDTVKIENRTNDAVIPYSPLGFLSSILLLKKKYEIKNGLIQSFSELCQNKVFEWKN